MQEIIDNFIEISKVPRCSFKSEKMELFLRDFAKKQGYTVQVDGAKNILVSHREPKMSLQAHYDMVCVGSAPKIETVIDGNILKAKNSSLGADNGMAIAMMMQLMKEQAALEFLFTSDEEVGLIGAKNLDLPIQSKYLLNLDSEDEGEVYIGCAGGVDLKFTKELPTVSVDGKFYKLSIGNFPGGHSGVDIDKGIPNAIVTLANSIKNNGLKIVSFHGGERINSIPANASAIVFANSALDKSKFADNKIEVEACDSAKVTAFDIDDLLGLPNGVLEKSEVFDVVQSSANIALADIEKGVVTIELSLRSLDTDELMHIAKELEKTYKTKGFEVTLNDKYPGWKPQLNEFTKRVEQATKDIFGECELKVIHAGLECGVLSEKLPNVKMASIGPNIRFPHSTREYVELDSVKRVYRVVKELLK